MNTYRQLIRVLLVVAAIAWGSLLGLAQTKASTATKPKNQAQPQAGAPAPQEKVWVKDPSKIMPMRNMTNADHKAAAERNKARRAQHDALRKQNSTVNQGVQR